MAPKVPMVEQSESAVNSGDDIVLRANGVLSPTHFNTWWSLGTAGVFISSRFGDIRL